MHAPVQPEAGVVERVDSVMSVHTSPLQMGMEAPQALHPKCGAGRGEGGPWAAHRLPAGLPGCFAHRQLGVPVLVLAYVCKPDHLALGNVLITC